MTKKGRQTKKVTRSRTPIGIIFVVVFGALVFATGFFLAGRQHFSSVDYGMRNSKLRKQIEDLETEKRRLIVAREITMSPNELRKAAKKLGLLAEPSAEPQLAAAIQPSTKPAESQPPAKTAPSNPLVVRTASVAETRTPVVPTVLKQPKPERTVKQIDTMATQVKRTMAAE